MNPGIPLRTDYDAAALRGLAKACADAKQARRLLALAAVYVANSLHNGLALADAIGAAVERWMGWTIGRRTERDTGIPHGLPYLTGFVTHCEIEAELFD